LPPAKITEVSRPVNPLGYRAVVTRMLLVRHGQSEWNALGRWQGHADPPLSALGREQARAAASRVASLEPIEPLEVVVSSDLERARATATILSELLGVGPVRVEPRLRERDAGEWSGLTRVEIEERWPGYLAERRRPPGFEPDHLLLERTRAALDDLAADHPVGAALVVTHGGVVYVLEGEAGIEAGRLPNLGARWITHDGGAAVLGERVELVDEASPETDRERV
jgi:probable phosphoglycerate mutase